MAFAGHDKISDNNLLTLGLTTRFLDADTGAQQARFGVAQRLRFEDQRVTLNSSTAPSLAGISDVMLGASVNASAYWAIATRGWRFVEAFSMRCSRQVIGSLFRARQPASEITRCFHWQPRLPSLWILRCVTAPQRIRKHISRPLRWRILVMQ
jgi:lipopolysaccharide assembly outer membrane protein LptD (OstA)